MIMIAAAIVEVLMVRCKAVGYSFERECKSVACCCAVAAAVRTRVVAMGMTLVIPIEYSLLRLKVGLLSTPRGFIL